MTAKTADGGVQGAVVGALIGSLSGAGLGAGAAILGNTDRDLEISLGHRRRGDRHSVGRSAAIGGITGAVLGGLAGAAYNYEKPYHGHIPRQPKEKTDPFFGPGAKKMKPLKIPKAEEWTDWGHAYPEKYLKKFYEDTPGGWEKVKKDSIEAGDKAPGLRAVASLKRVPETTLDIVKDPGAKSYSDLGGLRDEVSSRDETFDLDSPFSATHIKGRVPTGDHPFDPKMHGFTPITAWENRMNGMNGHRPVTGDEAQSLLLGHEARHSATMLPIRTLPQEALPPPSVYISRQAELTQAMGALKAETAQMSGRVLHSSDDFRQLMNDTGVTAPDRKILDGVENQYSPEGARMLNYMRTIWMKDPDKYESLLDAWDKEKLYDQVVKLNGAVPKIAGMVHKTTICCDLDGTLACSPKGKFDPKVIGKPIPAMMKLVRRHLDKGDEVRIFTARAADPKNIPPIRKWLKEQKLPALKITNLKTPDISCLIDDRAIGVEKDTGKLDKPVGGVLKRGSAKTSVPDSLTLLSLKRPFSRFGENPGFSEKKASDPALELLRQAKDASDKGAYVEKHRILRAMMENSPEDWTIDSESGGTYGLTHTPSGFRLHAPRSVVPLDSEILERHKGISPRKVAFAGLGDMAWHAMDPFPRAQRFAGTLGAMAVADSIPVKALAYNTAGHYIDKGVRAANQGITSGKGYLKDKALAAEDYAENKALDYAASGGNALLNRLKAPLRILGMAEPEAKPALSPAPSPAPSPAIPKPVSAPSPAIPKPVSAPSPAIPKPVSAPSRTALLPDTPPKPPVVSAPSPAAPKTASLSSKIASHHHMDHPLYGKTASEHLSEGRFITEKDLRGYAKGRKEGISPSSLKKKIAGADRTSDVRNRTSDVPKTAGCRADMLTAQGGDIPSSPEKGVPDIARARPESLNGKIATWGSNPQATAFTPHNLEKKGPASPENALPADADPKKPQRSLSRQVIDPKPEALSRKIADGTAALPGNSGPSQPEAPKPAPPTNSPSRVAIAPPQTKGYVTPVIDSHLMPGVPQAPAQGTPLPPLFPGGKAPYPATKLVMPEARRDLYGNETFRPEQFANQFLGNIPGGAEAFVAEQKKNWDHKPDSLIDFGLRGRPVSVSDRSPVDEAMGFAPPLPSTFRPFNRNQESIVYGVYPDKIRGMGTPLPDSPMSDGVAGYNGLPSGTSSKQTPYLLNHELGHTYLLADLRDAREGMEASGRIQRLNPDERNPMKWEKVPKNNSYHTDIGAEYLQGATSGLNAMRDITGQKINTPQQTHQLFNEIEANPKILDQINPENARIFRSYLNLRQTNPEAAQKLREATARDSQYLVQSEQQPQEGQPQSLSRQVTNPQKPESLSQKVKVAEVPGIPDRSDYGDISKLKAGDLLDMIVSRHDARRAGTHQDLRLGSPDTGLFSWATKKGLPTDAKPTALFRQPLHSHAYGGFEGDIPAGHYGAGSVKTLSNRKALITKSDPSGFSLTVAEGTPERYRFKAPSEGNDWMAFRRGDPPPPAYAKEHYPSRSIDRIMAELPEDGTFSVEPKIDGALQVLRWRNEKPEILSHRLTKDGRAIDRTEHLWGMRPDVPPPPGSKGLEFIGEFAAEREGRPVPPSATAGYLNSMISKAVMARNAGLGTKLRLFDVRGGPLPDPSGKSSSSGTNSQQPEDSGANVPGRERRSILESVASSLPGVEVMPETTTREGARQMVREILAGTHPLTKEGIIFRGEDGRPIKGKFRDEADVIISSIFPGRGKFQGGPGGFSYSREPGGPEVGRVGTGFSDEMRRSLEDYRGRVARIHHTGEYPSGAYRGTSFVAPHEDY